MDGQQNIEGRKKVSGKTEEVINRDHFKILAPLQTKFPTFTWMARLCSLHNSYFVMRIMRRRLKDGQVRGKS